MDDDFFLTNLELRESDESGEAASGLSHASMKGMFLLSVLELAARGEPRGAVTVLHDAGDHGGRYRELATALAQDGWAVALPDLRGHGQTEGDRGHSWGLREVCRDVQEIQDHLAYRIPVGPKVLVGVGLGALYAATFAVEHRGILSGLVLTGTLVEPTFERPEAPKGLGRFFKKGPQPTDAGRIPWDDAQLSAGFAADPATHSAITVRAMDEAERAASEYLPRIAEAGVPALVLHGSDDRIAPLDKARKLDTGGATFEALDGAGHHLFHGSGAAEVIERVRGWLDESLPR